MRSFAMCVLILPLIMLQPSCVSDRPTQPYKTSQEFITQAKVIEIDRARRKLTIRRADGQEITTVVEPEVQNFNQIEVGDLLEITVYESLILEVIKTDDLTTRTEAIAGQAIVDGKPQVGSEETLQVRAKIVDIDYENREITFETADGETTTLDVSRELKDMKQLKVGDVVQATITVAVTVAARKINSAN